MTTWQSRSLFRDSQCYVDFVASLNTVIQSHPAITFLIKPHPLSKLAPNAGADNVIFIDREANIHALIDTCDFVVCYNSGVGLLSLIHGKPLVAIGNAFYNVPGTGRFADSFEAAVLLGRECLAPESYVVRKLVAWYLKVRYSTFIARDDVVEFEAQEGTRVQGYSCHAPSARRYGSRDAKTGRKVNPRWP